MVSKQMKQNNYLYKTNDRYVVAIGIKFSHFGSYTCNLKRNYKMVACTSSHSKQAKVSKQMKEDQCLSMRLMFEPKLSRLKNRKHALIVYISIHFTESHAVFTLYSRQSRYCNALNS